MLPGTGPGVMSDGLREAFLRVLQRPKVELSPVIVATRTEGDLHYESILVNTEDGHRAPILLCKLSAATSALPTLFMLHGTGKSNQQLLELGVIQRFARLGYLVVGMDNRYHGERLPPQQRPTSPVPYYQALERAYLEGGVEKPFIYDNVWDLICVLDYLVTRPDVDANRIGSTGISLGGMHTWFLGLADSRVRVLAPAIGVQHFGYAIQHDLWEARVDSIPTPFEAARQHFDKDKVDGHVVRHVWATLTPGLVERFDAPQSLSALAPRPLLICNGEDDARCPADGVREAFDHARHAYKEAGVEEKLELFMQPGIGHEVTEEMWARVEEFLKKWL